MSSLVIFRESGVVAEWNKDGAYSVKHGDTRRTYATEAKALAAAKRLAAAAAPAPDARNLAKSLHTLTVLVRVGHFVHASNGAATPRAAVKMALRVLGLEHAPDAYGLADKAADQLAAVLKAEKSNPV